MQAYAKERFPGDWRNMSRVMFTGEFAAAFKLAGHGSHKYIPTDAWDAELGLPAGAGIYGYTRMEDGSYILETCRNGLAVRDENGTRFID
jgi:hypothetical protein